MIRASYLVFSSWNGLGSLCGKGDCSVAPGYGEGRDGAAPAFPGLLYPHGMSALALEGTGRVRLVQAVLCAGSDVVFPPQLLLLCLLLAARQQFFSGKLYVLL